MFPGPGNRAAASAVVGFRPGGKRLAPARLGSQVDSAAESCKFATLRRAPSTGGRGDP